MGAMKFLVLPDVLSIHQLIIVETGGQLGLRDQGLLESALKAAENRHYYEEADVIACAATYAYHLCMAHAFVDGNKRVAAAVSETFLLTNGWQLNMDNTELVNMFLEIADGALSAGAQLSAAEARQVHAPDGDNCWMTKRCQRKRSHYRNRRKVYAALYIWREKRKDVPVHAIAASVFQNGSKELEVASIHCAGYRRWQLENYVQKDVMGYLRQKIHY